MEALLHTFLTSTLDAGEWSTSRPGRLTSGERAPGTHWIWGWVGIRVIRTRWWRERIPSPHLPRFEPKTVVNSYSP